ncbi:MAG: tetratricopeptide repeat protein [Candidatus Hydrogenedentes bacterium]|nr:tetratricopeptide repeat protein [Candidatus Hydrogenedentota bacterium]
MKQKHTKQSHPTRGQSGHYVAPAVLVLLPLAAFWRVTLADYLITDDPETIIENPLVLGGLTFAGIRFAFTETVVGHWHPVTVLSHQIAAQLFGADPAWHHLINLAIHSTNGVLLYLLLRRMTERQWPSFFVAALFAMHPLRVESVAWITERKDVLSAFFFLLALIAYCAYSRKPGWRRYALLSGLFVLGLMSKSMLVTFPFVLLLLDVWPLRRVIIDLKVHAATLRAAWPLIVEKLPLFGLSLVFGVITVIAQGQRGALKNLETISIGDRIATALTGYVWYIGKTFWPFNLAFVYPHPEGSVPWWQVALAAIFLVAVTAWVVWRWRTQPYLLIGWLWYLGTLVPVIGILQAGEQSVADRFSYIPTIGLLITLVWLVVDVAERARIPLPLPAAFGAAVLLVLSVFTWIQVEVWRDSESVLLHSLKAGGESYVVRSNLGALAEQRGDFQEARQHFEAALRVRPDHPTALFNLAGSFVKQNQPAMAIPLYRKAITIQPEDGDVHAQLSLALFMVGDTEGAKAEVAEALRLGPENFTAREVAKYLEAGASQ